MYHCEAMESKMHRYFGQQNTRRLKPARSPSAYGETR
jgi:hypothetical protein